MLKVDDRPSNGQVLGIGIAGLGQLSREVHLPILATIPGIRIHAIADPDPGAIERCKHLARGAQCYSSLEGLLEDDSVHAVLVASPTAEHAVQARRVLAAGKALYLEKPLASTLAEGTELLKWAAAARRPVMIGFNYRFHPLVARARHLAAAHPFCRARSVFSIAPRPLPGWKQKRSSGGGVLLDLGSHHFDLLRFLLNAEVVTVNARVWSERTEDDCCEVKLDFDNGAQAQGLYSFCRTEEDVLAMTGSHGGIEINRYAPLGFPFWPLGDLLSYQLERRRSPWREVSFRRSLQAWIDCVRSGSTPPVTVHDGLASLRVVAAAEESTRTGGPVPLLQPTLSAKEVG